jgi:tetratricopeptide (TPR) repeat protein
MSKYEEAYAYTYLSFEQDPTNYSTNLNIGRYLAMSGSISMSIPYFEYALNTPSLPMQSEIYFTLSSLMISNKDGLYDIPKAIEYAEKSIETNPSYPMGYFALAQAYYMQNDASNHPKMEEVLKKSIELNPNGYNSYELL